MDDSDLPSAFTRLLNQVQRRSLRGVKRLVRPIWLHRLARRNLSSQETLLHPDGPVVSLTSFGQRLATVHYTLESMGQGWSRPSRLQLWLAHADLQRGVPETLQRLQARGLEILACEDLGPHKKYWPAVQTLPADRPLVTADDDVLYPRDWLESLTRTARAAPGRVICHRAHVVRFTAHGQLAPYSSWPACTSRRASHQHFSTGVGGVLYPPAMQSALKAAGTAFLDCCPKADDIWLKAVAFRCGTPVQQVAVFQPLLFELPFTRQSGLARDNVQGGGNDAQLAATFSAEELMGLRQAP